MAKPTVYDPVAQHDAPESSYGDSEDADLGFQRKQRGTVFAYAKHTVIVVFLLVLYTGTVVDLTKRITHRDRRVGRRFLNTPVDLSLIHI